MYWGDMGSVCVFVGGSNQLDESKITEDENALFRFYPSQNLCSDADARLGSAPHLNSDAVS